MRSPLRAPGRALMVAAAAAMVVTSAPIHSSAQPGISAGAARLAGPTATTTSRRHNLPPSPNYFNVCTTDGANSRACIKEVLAAIRRARAREHVKKAAMVLPRNYRKLSVAEQTFVVTDLERVDRGLRPVQGLTAQLNVVARTASVAHVDPTIATALLHSLGVDSYGSIWAADLGPLASDYDWMYNDGYSRNGDYNLACASPNAPGCWGHRDNILYRFSGFSDLIAGAGAASPSGESIAEVIAAGDGNPPKFGYTWRQALQHGADGR